MVNAEHNADGEAPLVRPTLPGRRGLPELKLQDEPGTPPIPRAKATPKKTGPKRAYIRTVREYPINLYPLGIVLYPGNSVQVELIPWVRRQIELGVLVEV